MSALKSATLGCFFLGVAAFAQRSTEPAALPEPQTLNVFYGLKDGGGALVSLEQQTTAGVQLSHGFMSAKVAGTTQISGGRSPVRLQVGQLEFAVATGGDPAVYSLRKLSLKKDKHGDNRELLIVTAQGAVFHASKANTAESIVPLDFSRYGTGSYRAVSRQPLLPGEYAFWRADSQTVFCFGVD
jgi:hypothetical protein